MVQIFLIWVVYAIKITMYVVFLSLKIAWKLLKLEGRAIRTCFRRYPIGFLSFFIHFLGFWTALILAYGVNNEFFLRIYTFGLCNDMDSYMNVVGFPMIWFTKIDTSSDVSTVILCLMAAVFVIPGMILYIEAAFVLFPVLYASLTQLILGIPFRDFVLRWRDKHDRDLWEEDNEAVVSYSNQRERAHVNNTVFDEALGGIRREADEESEMYQELSSVTFKANERVKYREFDESYNNVKKRIDDKTLKLFNLYEQLKKRGSISESLERMFEQTLSMHNEMHFVYQKAYETVCYTNDQEAMQACYIELKKEMIRVKNAQTNLTEAIKKVYGVQV